MWLYSKDEYKTWTGFHGPQGPWTTPWTQSIDQVHGPWTRFIGWSMFCIRPYSNALLKLRFCKIFWKPQILLPQRKGSVAAFKFSRHLKAGEKLTLGPCRFKDICMRIKSKRDSTQFQQTKRAKLLSEASCLGASQGLRGTKEDDHLFQGSKEHFGGLIWGNMEYISTVKGGNY